MSWKDKGKLCGGRLWVRWRLSEVFQSMKSSKNLAEYFQNPIKLFMENKNALRTILLQFYDANICFVFNIDFHRLFFWFYCKKRFPKSWPNANKTLILIWVFPVLWEASSFASSLWKFSLIFFHELFT